MDDPHLVAGAAGGHVETLLEEFLIAKRQGPALGSINEGDKDDVALVALELRGVTAEKVALFVTVRRDVLAKEIVNFNGLLVAHQRDDAEAERLTGVVLFVFRLLDRGGDQRGYCKSFLAGDLTVTDRAWNAIGHRGAASR